LAASLREEVIDLPALLRREVTVIAPLAQAAGIDLVLRLADATLGLRGDARMVRQMVLNLLSNAVRFSDRGTVTVSAEKHENGGIAVVVSDAGVGMSAEVVARLGEPYY